MATFTLTTDQRFREGAEVSIYPAPSRRDSNYDDSEGPITTVIAGPVETEIADLEPGTPYVAVVTLKGTEYHQAFSTPRED